jgi:predicted nucleic acid-binding Zn ribbon protein
VAEEPAAVAEEPAAVVEPPAAVVEEPAAVAEPPAAPPPPAVEEPPAPPVAVDKPAAAEPDQSTCPVCGEPVEPDEAFCATCGASLAQAPIPPEPVEAAEAGPAVQAEPAPTTCPACGNEVEPGDAFCSTCGFALQAVPVPQAPAAPQAPAVPEPSAAGPRLVVSASGAEIPLPDKDEILVGREDPVSGIYPDVDLTPHGGEEGGVSRRHARLVKDGGKYYVEDLDSTNFTFVNKQKLAPKARHVVGEGDEVRFGRVAVELRTV